MATTYTWEVKFLSCYPEYAGQTDVVFTVGWNLWGNNGTTNTYILGTTALTYTAGSPFTPYDQLTQTQVIGWITSALGQAGVAEQEALVDARIHTIENPSSVTPPLPWAG